MKDNGDVGEKSIGVKEVNGANQCDVENDVKANFWKKINACLLVAVLNIKTNE